MQVMFFNIKIAEFFFHDLIVLLCRLKEVKRMDYEFPYFVLLYKIQRPVNFFLVNFFAYACQASCKL